MYLLKYSCLCYTSFLFKHFILTLLIINFQFLLRTELKGSLTFICHLVRMSTMGSVCMRVVESESSERLQGKKKREFTNFSTFYQSLQLAYKLNGLCKGYLLPCHPSMTEVQQNKHVDKQQKRLLSPQSS